MDTKQCKKIAGVEVGKHEKRMHAGAQKMAAGGVTNSNLKKYGRNMARAKNQGSK